MTSFTHCPTPLCGRVVSLGEEDKHSLDPSRLPHHCKGTVLRHVSLHHNGIFDTSNWEKDKNSFLRWGLYIHTFNRKNADMRGQERGRHEIEGDDGAAIVYLLSFFYLVIENRR